MSALITDNNAIPLDAHIERDLFACIDELALPLQELLATLVRFPSLLGNEASAQDFMQGLFAGMGLKVDRFGVDDRELRDLPGYAPPVGEWKRHDNVVASYVPRSKVGRSLILNGHIDVVPVGAAQLWTNDPFEPVVKEGRLYGRGAGDMKAGIAAYVMAFEALRRIGMQPAAPLWMQSVVEEECTGNGALACLHRGYRADAAIIPEPFNHTILEAQVGVMWVTIEVFGRPAHVLDVSQGINAIEAAFELYQGLTTLRDEWNQSPHRPAVYDGVKNPINFNLGKIQGGEWTSSVATRCEMEVRCGFFPGLTAAQARHAVESKLAAVVRDNPKLRGVKHHIRYAGLQSEGCIIDRTLPLMRLLGEAHQRVMHNDPVFLPSTATTDVRIFHMYGDTPATCYGPESSSIHGIDESVSLESTLQVTRVLAWFIARWCGLERASQ